MAGRTPEEAAENFVNFIKESLSCVTSHFLNAHSQSSELHKIFYDPYPTVHTRSGPSYRISVTQIFRVVNDPNTAGQYKAKTQEYSYRLLKSGNTESEIVAYHWHPQDPGVRYPHLHVKAAHPRIHFPTSRVCLEDFVSMLMRDFHVRPKLSHDECKRILSKNKEAFERMATWKIQNP